MSSALGLTTSALPIAAFASEHVDALESLPPAIRVTGMNLLQRVSLYVELTVALIWKITGVSWSRLAILSGVTFGTGVALTFWTRHP